LIRVTQDDDPQKPDFHFRLAKLYAARPSPLQALAAYLEVTAHRTYPRRDEALWEAAGILRSAGRPEEARTFLRRLIDEHPGSRHLPAAAALLLE
jgi:tetratricopeptide (TPR) repeat protein